MAFSYRGIMRYIMRQIVVEHWVRMIKCNWGETKQSALVGWNGSWVGLVAQGQGLCQLGYSGFCCSCLLIQLWILDGSSSVAQWPIRAYCL